MKKNLLQNLSSTRGSDIFPSLDMQEEMISVYFPNNTFELTQNLSNVTSAFYGLLLKNIGIEMGNEKIDEHSKKLFYELGKLKTSQALEIQPNLYNDTRAFAVVLISAIYNASPEYQFNIKKYSPEETTIVLSGVDRYLRILNELDIDTFVTFPTLLPFLEGIKDCLNIDCTIEGVFKKLEKKHEAISTYTFKIL